MTHHKDLDDKVRGAFEGEKESEELKGRASHLENLGRTLADDEGDTEITYSLRTMLDFLDGIDAEKRISEEELRLNFSIPLSVISMYERRGRLRKDREGNYDITQAYAAICDYVSDLSSSVKGELRFESGDTFSKNIWMNRFKVPKDWLEGIGEDTILASKDDEGRDQSSRRVNRDSYTKKEVLDLLDRIESELNDPRFSEKFVIVPELNRPSESERNLFPTFIGPKDPQYEATLKYLGFSRKDVDKLGIVKAWIGFVTFSYRADDLINARIERNEILIKQAKRLSKFSMLSGMIGVESLQNRYELTDAEMQLVRDNYSREKGVEGLYSDDGTLLKLDHGKFACVLEKMNERLRYLKENPAGGYEGRGCLSCLTIPLIAVGALVAVEITRRFAGYTYSEIWDNAKIFYGF